VPIGDLFFDRGDLLDIFTTYTTSDINSAETMLEVLKLLIASRNAAIKEVHFPAELGPSYVYATHEAISEAVEKFLGIEASSGPRGSLEDAGGGSKKNGSGGSNKGGKHKHGHQQKKQHLPPPPPGGDELIPAGEAGVLEAKSVTRKVSSGFPVFYPTRLPSGARYVESNSYEHVQDPRVYHFKDSDGNRHGAYRMVVELPLSDGTHYFGLQGIQGWADPPILNNPTLTKTINGREYEIFVDGDRLPVVAWHRGDNTYWVSNDLLNTLTNDQMLGMARSASVLIPNPKRKHRKAQR